MIDRLTVDKIIDAANIVDVVSDFVTLKRAGANLKGLCPFHEDHTPSFVVSPARNTCKCFSCGEGGTPVSFIMKHEQLSYPDALRYLAKKYGIKIEERELTEDERQSRGDRDSMFILNEWARDWFSAQLWDTDDGRAIGLAYFRSRGFRDDILKKFQVGFSPNNRKTTLSAEAQKAGYRERYLVNNQNEMEPRLSIGTGLSIKQDDGKLRDRFRGRVIWPIFTASGRVAGFGGRVLDAATKGVNVKYLNSPESIIYSKRKELFGLFQARQAIRKQDLCYLVEGYTDVMAMHQQGVENVVASSGTALTSDQIRLIHRITDNITVIFDGDEAGIHASERGIDMLLSEGMNVRLLLLPDGDDPDSFARKHTATEFQEYLREHQVDFITYKASHAAAAAAGDPDAEGRLVHNVAESIAVIPDEIRRVVYIRHAAQQLQMPERLIAAAVNAQIAKAKSQPMPARQTTTASPAPPPITHPGEGEYIAEAVKAGGSGKADASLSLGRGAGSGGVGATPAETSIIHMIIRYGGMPMCYIEDEEGHEKPLSVAEYISYSLQDDGMQLSTPLFQRMLDEAVAGVQSGHFRSEQYFLNHPDDEVRTVSLRLGPDTEELSKLFDMGEKLASDSANEEGSGAGQPNGTATTDDSLSALDERIPKLVAAYKLGIVRGEMQSIAEQMKDPATKQDKERRRSLMEEFSRKQRLVAELARESGERVVLK